MVLKILLFVVGIAVAAVSVLPIHLGWAFVVVLPPVPLLPKLLSNIPSLSTYSIPLPTIYVFYFHGGSCIPLNHSINCLCYFYDILTLRLLFQCQLIVEISLLSLPLKCTSKNHPSPQHGKYPNSIVEEISDELPCCVTHLWYFFIWDYCLMSEILYSTQGSPKYNWNFPTPKYKQQSNDIFIANYSLIFTISSLQTLFNMAYLIQIIKVR